FDRLCDTTTFHKAFILPPVGLQVVGIVCHSTKIHRHERGAQHRFNLIVDLPHTPCGGTLSHEVDSWHTRLLRQTSLSRRSHNTSEIMNPSKTPSSNKQS